MCIICPVYYKYSYLLVIMNCILVNMKPARSEIAPGFDYFVKKSSGVNKNRPLFWSFLFFLTQTALIALRFFKCGKLPIQQSSLSNNSFILLLSSHFAAPKSTDFLSKDSAIQSISIALMVLHEGRHSCQIPGPSPFVFDWNTFLQAPNSGEHLPRSITV